jgi:hypothetical protein
MSSPHYTYVNTLKGTKSVCPFDLHTFLNYVESFLKNFNHPLQVIMLSTIHHNKKHLVQIATVFMPIFP